LHEQQQQLQGTNYELPDFFGKHRSSIAVALVTIDENDEIQNVVYVERVAEMCFIGIDPKATAVAQREINGLRYLLNLQGYRWMHVLVPSFLRAAIAKPLRRAGFVDRTHELATFTIEVPSGDCR
jgi:hypothetical protein